MSCESCEKLKCELEKLQNEFENYKILRMKCSECYLKFASIRIKQCPYCDKYRCDMCPDCECYDDLCEICCATGDHSSTCYKCGKEDCINYLQKFDYMCRSCWLKEKSRI